MNQKLQKTSFILALIISTLLLAGCPSESAQNTNTSETKNYPTDKAGIEELHNDLMALLVNKSCQQASDCEVIALGARACGGPDAYEVYAPANTNKNKLEQLAAEYKNLRKAYNQKNQIVSICSVVPVPAVACVENQCKKTTEKLIIQ